MWVVDCVIDWSTTSWPLAGVVISSGHFHPEFKTMENNIIVMADGRSTTKQHQVLPVSLIISRTRLTGSDVLLLDNQDHK